MVAKPRNIISVCIEISAIVIHSSRTVDDALPRSSLHCRSIAEIPIQTLITFLGYATTILTRKLGVPVEFYVMN